MTVAIAMVDPHVPERTWVAAESRVTSGGRFWQSLQPKAWRQDSILIAFAGSPIIPLTYRDDPAAREADTPLDRWLVRHLHPKLRQIAKDCQQDKDDWECVIAAEGRVFALDASDISEPAAKRATVGCGAQFADGALSAFDAEDAVAQLHRALQAACDNDSRCAPPFTVLCS